ncbi:MAG: helix-turn-helix domain-containing protein [Candidatus Latescibacteria bacterium]|nr:helix-turn-helix domain-containing protein [Candidatus Latescibacterota bacterium]
MAKAEEALKHTSDSISEIAYRCGFTSLSTFSKVFKATYGNNPTTYRKFHFRNYLSMWFYVLIDF